MPLISTERPQGSIGGEKVIANPAFLMFSGVEYKFIINLL